MAQSLTWQSFATEEASILGKMRSPFHDLGDADHQNPRWDACHTLAYQRFLTAQRLMIIKMMGNKRRPLENGQLEPWLDWHIRLYSTAKRVIIDNTIDLDTKVHQLRRSWAQHIARFELQGKDVHCLKHVCLWRCRALWSFQRLFNSLNWQPCHMPRSNRVPRWWEETFSTNWPLYLASL